MKRCKLFLIEALAVSGLLFCAAAQADYGYYHYSTLDGPATDTDGDYYLSWYVIPTDPNAQYDTVEVAYLETRMNGAGTWQQVQEWNDVPIYAAYDDVHRTGQAVGTHNYHMIFLIYSPYTGYDVLEDYWNVVVTTPPPPPVPGVTTPPSEVTSGLSVGTTPYGMDVATNGDAVVSVPLQLIPGVAGFKPNLGLVYSSGRGVDRLERKLPEDTIGYGWRVDGLSQIRRCVVGQDGANNIQLNGNDSLCLDGMPLVKVSGTHLSQGAIYRTQIESYTTVKVEGSAGALWFTVTTADGTVLEYGNDTSNGSRVDLNGGVDYQWSVSKATSADGNIITYSYHHNTTKGINYPLTITYEDAHVVFSYAERTDADPVNIVSGVAQEQVVSLHTISVVMDTAKVREYRLFHETDAGGNLRLKKLQQCGYNTAGTVASCLNPLEFTWAVPSPTMNGVPIYLTKIKNGLGAENEFVYSTITQGGANTFLYTEAPFGSATAPTGTQLLSSGTSGAALRHVVTQVKRESGVGGTHNTSYAYKGKGLESTEHWGFLGFFAQRIEDEQSGIFTYAQYRMDYPFFGQVARLHQYESIYSSSSTPILTKAQSAYLTENTVTVSPTIHVTYPYAARTINFLFEDNTALGATQTVTAPSLSGGLITQVITTTSTATGATDNQDAGTIWGDVSTYTLSGVKHTAQNTAKFINRTNGEWLIGFTNELSTETWNGTPSGSGLKQKTTFSHHTGSLKVASFTRFPDADFPNTDLRLTTSFIYDSKGRTTSTTIEGDEVASRTTGANTFHDERYPLVFTNPLLPNTTIGGCDLRFGAYTVVTDPSVGTASTVYDPFGRIVSTTSPDGVVTTTTFAPNVTTVEGVASVYWAETVSSIAPTRRTYHDKLGRVIRTETRSFNGTYSKQDTKYDIQGRVEKVSVPYITGSAPGYAIYGYDERDRVTSLSRPQGSGTATTTTDYTVVSGEVVVAVSRAVLNAAGTSTVHTQQKRSTYNILGQLVKTIDAYGTADASTVEYTYDANGNMRTAILNGTVTTTMFYDAAGNRTELQDPNAGTITTEYTALGEVKKVTNAANRETTFDYDKLGRITQRINDDGTSTWVWDIATNGAGKLASRNNGAGGFTETYYYNSSKKLSSTVTGVVPIGGSSATNFTTSYTYDGYGRPLTTTYPSSVAITRVYNSYGYLSQLKQGSTVLQTFNSADAFGNVTQETYGNGVVTTRAFDPKTGRLTAIDTKKGSTWIQENDYAWRSNGILESRISKSGTAVRQETFGYDLHNRLKSAATTINSTPQRELTYNYDALGNLDDKQSDVTADADVENYNYGGTAGPNAVTSVSVGGIPIDLTYNTNGAITKYDLYGTSTDKYIEYNATNQPTRIVLGTSLTDTAPQARDLFRYDMDGNRIYKQSIWQEGGTTRQEDIYYVGGYEAAYYVNDPSMYAVLKTRIGRNIMHVVAVDNSFNVFSEIEYAHRDHLGSIEKVTNGSGAVMRTLAYEPFGGRRANNWQSSITAGELAGVLQQLFIPDFYYPDWHLAVPLEARGFTGHEHLDRTGFIHMNGRVYDPQIGRFLSPDPIVQAPTNSQSWNRYSYVLNSPLSLMDPSGYEWVTVCQPSGLRANAQADCPNGEEAMLMWVDDTEVVVSGSSWRPRWWRGLTNSVVSVVTGWGPFFGGGGGGGGSGHEGSIPTGNDNIGRDADGEESTQGDLHYKYHDFAFCSADELFSQFSKPDSSAPGAPAAAPGTTPDLELTGGNPITQIVDVDARTITNVTQDGHRYHSGTVEIRITQRWFGSSVSIEGRGTGPHFWENRVLGFALFTALATKATFSCTFGIE